MQRGRASRESPTSPTSPAARGSVAGSNAFATRGEDVAEDVAALSRRRGAEVAADREAALSGSSSDRNDHPAIRV